MIGMPWHRPKRSPMVAMLQHDDGGIEVLYDQYRHMQDILDDTACIFARDDFVCAVVYRDGVALTTVLPGGKLLAGEHWQRPKLPPGAVIVIDATQRPVLRRVELPPCQF